MPVTEKRELKDVPLDNLIPYERNPRKNDKAIKKVAASLEQFGLVKNSVVVDEDMVLITGHTTTKAMRSLWTIGGWREMTIAEHYAEDLAELTAPLCPPDPPEPWDRE